MTTITKPAYKRATTIDWSTTARKVALIAANTMSKSKTVLEITAAGLDAR